MTDRPKPANLTLEGSAERGSLRAGTGPRAPRPASRPVVKDRLSVVEAVYHTPFGKDPVSTESRFSRWLETDEQPYVRRIKVGPEWRQLDAGWLAAASMLLVANEEGLDQTRQPTQAELAASVARVVLVGVWAGGEVVPCFRVPPGESMRAEPVSLGAIRLRCEAGEARCVITIYPA